MSTNNDKKIIVLAGNIEQFNRYLEEYGLTTKEAVYGWSPEVINGVEAKSVVEIGTFYERKDKFELRELANSRIR